MASKDLYIKGVEAGLSKKSRWKSVTRNLITYGGKIPIIALDTVVFNSSRMVEVEIYLGKFISFKNQMANKIIARMPLV